MKISKRYILQLSIILMFFSFISNAQTDWGIPIDQTTNKILYTEVVEVEGINKDILFKRANTWILNYYKTGYKKIKEKSKEEGYILVKDRILLFKMERKTKVNDAMIDYKIEFNFKDGKFKYKIFDFYHYQRSLSSPLEEWIEDGKTDKEEALARFNKINSEIEQLITNMKLSMLKSTVDETDDW